MRKSTAQTGAPGASPGALGPRQGPPSVSPPLEALRTSCSLGNHDMHAPCMLAHKWDAFVDGRKLPVRDGALFYLGVGETGREAS